MMGVSILLHARAIALDQSSLLEQKWGGSSHPTSDGLHGMCLHYAICFQISTLRGVCRRAQSPHQLLYKTVYMHKQL